MDTVLSRRPHRGHWESTIMYLSCVCLSCLLFSARSGFGPSLMVECGYDQSSPRSVNSTVGQGPVLRNRAISTRFRLRYRFRFIIFFVRFLLRYRSILIFQKILTWISFTQVSIELYGDRFSIMWNYLFCSYILITFKTDVSNPCSRLFFIPGTRAGTGT